MHAWHQTPEPGSQLVLCCGDLLHVSFTESLGVSGTAWLRTNIGAARKRRREIIDHVEHRAPILAGDWHDLAMVPMPEDRSTFHIRVPLHEPGVFEAKAFFLPKGSDIPVWPQGPNLHIKVEPAVAYGSNTIYTAFVRQFGPNRCNREELPVPPDTLLHLDAKDWTLIPKSGTFRALAAQLDHIIGTLGFRIIQLLPIHPVPTTFARMGRFGSPFAAIDFFNVDPALAEFDRSSTPLDQFQELVDAVHSRQALLFLDLPINHTGWASHLQVHHPEWFARNTDNSFASPGAWGVTWEDLSELDYHHIDLWHYMADVFLFWCDRGVDGFRCDAGYMIPLPVWEYIIAKVRMAFPDTLFLLEGLGGRISVMQALLSQANLNWAYSEIFQVYDRTGLEQQIRMDHTNARLHGSLVHFAETHDNNRLAATSLPYARMRTALAALTADAGAFGITNGVEWYATAKVDVHGAPPLNWDSGENQISNISNLNRLLQSHPAFHHGAQIEVLASEGAVLQVRRSAASGKTLLVLVNLDTEHSAIARWPALLLPPREGHLTDLITDNLIDVREDDQGALSCQLEPAQALCLASAPLPTHPSTDPIARQRLKALALKLVSHVDTVNKTRTQLTGAEPDEWADLLAQNPGTFCSTLFGVPDVSCITTWNWPEDLSRVVMLPTRHALLLRSPVPFEVRLSTRCHTVRTGAESLAAALGQGHFALLFPDPDLPQGDTLLLRVTVYRDGKADHRNAQILRLAGDAPPAIPLQLDRESLRGSKACAILTNGCGALSQVRLEWGHIESQYDCLLGANLHPRVPVDRHVLLTRCRAWLLHKGYSHEIGIDCTRHVSVNPGHSVEWLFDAPAGMGRTVGIAVRLFWAQGKNQISLSFQRLPAAGNANWLPDKVPVTLILRPDIEDRNNHCATKAYMGPEHHWPAALQPAPDGFRFCPGPHATLSMQMQNATFTHAPEWTYGVPHPFEADRGLDPNGDLFSPGYFNLRLDSLSTHLLQAAATNAPLPDHTTHAQPPTAKPEPSTRNQEPAPPPEPRTHQPDQAFQHVLRNAIRDFIVRRDDSHTVIAGYPWFLDWGRDTLICLRGIISAGLFDQARDILKQFARFEQQGTIPNMIRGTDDRDRDTSDAPLWFFTACRDLLQATNDPSLLQMDCNGRPLIDILRSIAQHYRDGTPNGIRMDPDSALIYSPSHFTWMDTNYPAGTPRQGYPIEIQALWFAALRFLSEIDPDTPRWATLSQQVQRSILQFYPLPEIGSLSDCLHAGPGGPAAKAVADNALRPNQLFAITLGAIQDKQQIRQILDQCARLLVPGAIRSLADQAVSPPLPVHGPFGLLNNPEHPYQGRYQGDEDSRRKPAYHNGTAWTWPFPSYCEALAILDPMHLAPIAREFLYSGAQLLQKGCIAQLPEILDGNAPHTQRGCWAQAWGATEFFRVHQHLHLSPTEPSGGMQSVPAQTREGTPLARKSV